MNVVLRFVVPLLATLSIGSLALGHEIVTNAVRIENAPAWLKRVRVNKVAARMEKKMEWTIRKINVHWYNDQVSFNKVHNRGSAVQAFARKSDNSVHIGPKVNDGNFDAVFGHELAHIISYQKYKGAIPSWLEEGMANHLAQKDRVDYKWMSKQPFPKDVRTLSHPVGGSLDSAKYKYMASRALVEMLSKKCDLRVLLQLSVERKMEDYIKTLCQVPDLNVAFKEWVKKRSS